VKRAFQRRGAGNAQKEEVETLLLNLDIKGGRGKEAGESDFPFIDETKKALARTSIRDEGVRDE